MYGQILTNKDGRTVKILSFHDEVYIVSHQNDHTSASDTNYTKQDLIDRGWIFPVEKWTPALDEEYYVPSVISDTKYSSFVWNNRNFDNACLANNLVCRTPEEARALTDKMLGAVGV